MNTRLKSSFNLFVVLALLVVLFGMSPVASVQADAAEHPLAAGGIWAKSMGGVYDEEGLSIALDSSGNIYTAGVFYDTIDFDPGPGTFYLTSDMGSIFISKLDSGGNFIWAKKIDARSLECNMIVDSSGNVYLTGTFSGTVDFDPNSGVYTLDGGNGISIFASKLDGNGGFVWAKGMTGGVENYLNESFDIAMDATGHVYMTGRFSGTIDFDPGPGIYNLSSADDSTYDIFISKLDNNGNFIAAKHMGGTNFSDTVEGYGIAIDSSNNIYTTGFFKGTVDFNPDAGIFNLSSLGEELFVSKLDGNGNFVWARNFSGGGGYGLDIVTDSSGNVYTTGFYSWIVDFDPGPAEYKLTSTGGYDIFVSKLDGGGNFAWAKSMGGNWDDAAYSITLDSSGNIYTTGYFVNSADFDPGLDMVSLPAVDASDIFVSKLDATGNYVWAKSMGGADWDLGASIALDASGNVYTTGGYAGTADFDPGPNIYNLTSIGENDIFVSKLDNDPSIQPTFGDVSFNHPLYKYIQALYENGFAVGCSTEPLMFCPDLILDRAQSAVFMLYLTRSQIAHFQRAENAR